MARRPGPAAQAAEAGSDKPVTTFDRYTDRANRCVTIAQEEAGKLGHAYTDAHHLLLALAVEGEGVAAQALKQFGLDGDALRAAVTTVTPPRDARVQNGRRPLGRRIARAMELAQHEALVLATPYVGTEHLLLGVIRESETDGSLALAVMNAAGHQPGAVRNAVMELLRGYETREADAATGPATLATLQEQVAALTRKVDALTRHLGVPVS